MLYNASCTVYRINDSGGYDRYFIPECFWEETHGYKLATGGFVKDDSITVQIPEKYAASAPRMPQKDILVQGDCRFTFDNSNPATISASLRELRDGYKPATVVSADIRLYGRGLRHIRVTAV